MSQHKGNVAKKQTNTKTSATTSAKPKANTSAQTSEKSKISAQTSEKSTTSVQSGTKPKTAASAKPKVKTSDQTSVKSQVKTAKKVNSASKKKSEDDFEARMKRRDEERARRREARAKKVRRQKIAMAVSAVVIVAAAIISVVVFTRPSMKLSRSLSKGDKYVAQEDYENALSAYEGALQIDSTSVTAYRSIADTYLQQGKAAEAKQILYSGWEETQDEGILHYYCVELHNEAVEEVNQGNCTLSTVDKFIQVLELESDNTDTMEALRACYEYLFQVTDEEDTCMMFFDTDTSQDTCSYEEYEQLIRRMLTVYEGNPSDGLKNILARYTLIDMPYMWISIPHVDAYMTLLTDINQIIQDSDITETLACLDRAKEVQEYFSTAFTEFEAGNYAYARDLVATDSYQQIRDDFIGGNSGYWEGSVYIPVNREQLVLHREDEQVKFYFPDAGDYENHYGIIKVWGTVQEDDGVQRSAISYEPVEENGADSHTEYTVQYLYSNVKIGGQYVPQMNFRFDTKITTEEGITTNAIGDWGGEHEWEIDY